DNATLLKIYALYKQASEGDVDGKRPGMTDFVGRAKYDAWAAIKGKSKNDAMQEYVELIESLQ
ncbi:MAG TPA: acyl-CoA-binding protein, partial [Rubrivivax sp.]|nr:acyl-CoA-binding protein [Rubrivivax sp.]